MALAKNHAKDHTRMKLNAVTSLNDDGSFTKSSAVSIAAAAKPPAMVSHLVIFENIVSMSMVNG